MADTHVDGPRLVAPPTTGVHRVGRADRLLRYAEITPADAALPNAGNRFDVVGGGVLYSATEVEGCYAETLARFRPTAAMRALLKDEKDFMFCGGVPQDWRVRRLQVGVTLTDALPFVDVEDPQTHEFLTNELAEELRSLSVDQIDVAVVRGPNRLVSRAMSSWAHAAFDEDDLPLYPGVRYVSRLGDYECWAVFDGTALEEISRSTIEEANPALKAVAKDFGLRVF